MRNSAAVKMISPPVTGIPSHMEEVLGMLGEDPTRDGLIRTPERWDKAMRFLTSGYQTRLEDVVNGALFAVKFGEMVLVKDIKPKQESQLLDVSSPEVEAPLERGESWPLIDVRSLEKWANGNIPGARFLTLELKFEALDTWPKTPGSCSTPMRGAAAWKLPPTSWHTDSPTYATWPGASKPGQGSCRPPT